MNKNVKKLFCINFFLNVKYFILFFVGFSPRAQSQIVPHGHFRGFTTGKIVHAQGPICTDGSISDIVEANHLIFLGGSFNFAGTCTGAGHVINKTTGQIGQNPSDSIFYKIDGSITTSISDGADGWYIAGTFSTVDGVSRRGLAHINADGSLDLTFSPVIESLNQAPTINTLKLNGGKLYVGGQFDESNGVTVQNLVALSPITGANIAWSAKVGGRGARDIVFVGTDSYVIGDFLYAGDSSTFETGALFLDQATKQPLANQPVFTNDGLDSNYTGLSVRISVGDGSGGFFVGGVFTHVNGIARRGLVYLNADLSVNTNFNPVINGYYISEMFYQSNVLYLVGDFKKINGQYRFGVAGLNKADGTLTNFNLCNNSYLNSYEYEDLTGDGTNVFLSGVYGVNGTCTGGGAMVDNTNGSPVTGTPVFNGTVFTAASDGSGGWYVSGEFTEVSGILRNRFAHIQSDGSVGSWNPGLTFEGSNPRSMIYDSGTIYIGGGDFVFGGTTRIGIAALDTSGNLISGFQINSVTADYYGNVSNAEVIKIILLGSKIYLIGQFDKINSVSRMRIAAVDKLTGALDSFSISSLEDNLSGSVFPTFEALDTDGTHLFVGGRFDKINGSNRTGLASIDTSGNLRSWNPVIANTWGYQTNEIFYLAVHGSNVAFSGNFNRLNGSIQWAVGAVDMSGTRVNWQPQLFTDNNYMFFDTQLVSAGGNLFVTGTFSKTNSTSRRNFAAFDSSFALTAWQPKINYPFLTNNQSSIFAKGSSVFLTGRFSKVGVDHRSGIAHFDSSGTALAFNPTLTTTDVSMNYSAYVRDLVYFGNQLYVAGSFDKVNGSTRKGIARFDNSLNLTSFAVNFSSNPDIRDIKIIGNLIYFGAFSIPDISGVSRPNAKAAVDLNGALDSWQPIDMNYDFISDSGTRLYYGSNDYQNQNSLKTIEVNSSNTLSAWDANFFTMSGDQRFPNWISESGTSLALSFNTNERTIISTNPRDSIAKFDASGNLQPFSILLKYSNPSTYRYSDDGSRRLFSVETDGTNVYIGGNFSSVNGTTKNNFASIDSSGNLNALNINADDAVTKITKVGSQLYLGGYFTSVQGTPRNSLASVDLGGNLSSWNPNLGSPAPVFSIVDDGTSIYVGGVFVTVGGEERFNFAKVNSTTGAVQALNPRLTGDVKSISLSSDRVLIGGFVTAYGAHVRRGLAAIDENSNLTNWTADISGTIDRMAFDAGKLYLAGDNFVHTLTSNPLERLISIDLNGQLSSWTAQAGAGGFFSNIEVDNSIVYISGGYLYEVNSTPRQGIAALDLNGNLLPFEISTDGNVYNFYIDGNDLYVYGEFYNVQGNPRHSVAKFSKAGVLDPWNAQSNNLVNNVFRYGSHLYFTGAFTSIGGQSRSLIASFDNSGNVTAFNPVTSFQSYGAAFNVPVGLFGDNLLVDYYTVYEVNGAASSSLVSFDLSNGTYNNMSPLPFSARYEDSLVGVPFPELYTNPKKVRHSRSYFCQKAYQKIFCQYY